MGTVRDELNMGQLCRECFRREAALIGFGMHTGTIAAASDWDGEMERVRPSHQDSYERQRHDSGKSRFLLDFSRDEALRRRLIDQQLERHYASASLTQQFDAFVWFDETQAVTPLGSQHAKAGPETYPFGM
jgi:erythromycin esterase-like protein